MGCFDFLKVRTNFTDNADMSTRLNITQSVININVASPHDITIANTKGKITLVTPIKK